MTKIKPTEFGGNSFMYKDELLEHFSKTQIDFGIDLFEIISSKTDDEILFPPYVPLVGGNYDKFKILIYSTAQNIKYDSFRDSYQRNLSKLPERLYYFNSFSKKYPYDKMSYTDIDINPYRKGIIPALLGVFIYAKYGEIINDLNELHNFLAISNYYKFSLNKDQKDIHPENKRRYNIKEFIVDQAQIDAYWETNDNLVKSELSILRPNFILSFNGRRYRILKQFACKSAKLFSVNDPSWILQGGSGVFSEGKSWWKKADLNKNAEISDLVDHYLVYLQKPYQRKKEQIRIYLLKYYNDWQQINAR